MEKIKDIQNYIRKRQQKGKTAVQIRNDLQAAGYDWHAAIALLMRYWEPEEEEKE